MSERFVLCNMTTEMGAKVGLIEADQVTKQYLAHSGRPFHPIASDEDAAFSKTFSFEVDGMGPQVACPSNPANLKPVEDVEGTKIDVAFLGSLAGDEVCISSTNRNYPGRMGSPQAQVYLASPWTVTASAIHGEITDPRKV